MLIDPMGTQISNLSCVGPSNFLGAQTLAYTGTYTLGIDPKGTTGTVSVDVNAFTTVTSVLQFDSPATISIPFPGQTATLTFGGNAGQVIDFAETSTTFRNCWNTTILNPDGSTLNNGTSCGDGASGSFALPMSGTYSIFINPNGQAGSFTATLTQLITQPIAFNNPLGLNINLPGQVYDLTFSGTANQVIGFAETGTNFRSCWNTTILNPDGSTLNSGTWCGDAAADNLKLPQTGTYTIQFNLGSQVGPLTATLTQLSTQTIALDSPISINDTLPGQVYNLTFSGTPGQLIDLAQTGTTFRNCWNGSIFNPDGTTLFSGTWCGDGASGDQTLQQTGTYTIQINPNGQTGNTTVTLTQLITQPIAFSSPVTLNINLPGQVYDLTFSGTAGHVIDLSLAGATFRNCWGFTILNPDGTTLATPGSCGNSADTGNLTLTRTGTYSIYSSGVGSQTGSITANLTLIQ